MELAFGHLEIFVKDTENVEETMNSYDTRDWLLGEMVLDARYSLTPDGNWFQLVNPKEH